MDTVRNCGYTIIGQGVTTKIVSTDMAKEGAVALIDVTDSFSVDN